MIKIRILQGRWADCSELEDRAHLRAVVNGGAHHSHVVEIYSSKYSCGGVEYYAECSCGARWWSELRGCPEHNHREGGDRTLREVLYADEE
ncbi:MAG: hypothetical protein RMM10_13305 [Anaerolineae bacterium]|uniref:hypothetical protein n=1 Tax=Thermoflexus sp. TaxID=1969742 RepID=UPI0025EDA793|nr:hypothetical protein [Thermoflexus sp.]MCS7352456.1 hypothetical protein [Thermoflexus sp.]MDW8181923.1 hypothetical protein [Anaerolineae bacterium]